MKDHTTNRMQVALAAIRKNPLGYVVLAVLIVLAASGAYAIYLGPRVPGAFLERSSYSNKLYVLVFPKSNSSKNYYLPATIYRDDNGYSIDSLTWPNGGYSTFDSCQIYLNQKADCTITNSKEFEDYVQKSVENPNYFDVQALLNEPSLSVQLTSNVVSR